MNITPLRQVKQKTILTNNEKSSLLPELLQTQLGEWECNHE